MRKIISLMLAGALLTPLAFAQDGPPGGHPQQQGHGGGGPQHGGGPGGPPQQQGGGGGRGPGPGGQQGPGPGGYGDGGHGGYGDGGGGHGSQWRNQHGFRAGDRIPDRYNDRRYYVDDYGRYDLPPPSRGHRWVRDDDGDYILVAVATGVIAEILANGR